MCGIAGFYSQRNTFTKNELAAMSSAIRHRGPDADGIYCNNGVGLAHRRLSIIDLSDDANQPMTLGAKTLVYNGEVYNYDLLRREQRFSIRTSSDTEIVLQMLAMYGAGAFEYFNGMFSLALFDAETRKLTIARDRLGIKPLYYFWDGTDFAFASELKSLLQLKSVKQNVQINQQAVNQFLHLGFIPEPNSIYSSIYKLPAGAYAQFDGTTLGIDSYWSPAGAVSDRIVADEMQARELLRDLVEDSVRLRLRSDVPFGTFLSGGIDSSLVTAVAQRNSNKTVRTFSIGFDDAKHDESKFARDIASYLCTDHHEFRVTEKDTIALVPELLSIYDEPYADSSAFPTLLVSKLARQEVTMTLSGDGGDELFMGYGSHAWAERLAGTSIGRYRNVAGAVASLLPSRYKRVGHLLRFDGRSDERSHIFSQEQYLFSQAEIAKIRKNRATLAFGKMLPAISRNYTPAERQAFFELSYYLPDDLLVKVDRASMRTSLEARVPLLDHTIVEFALNLSPGLKIKNGVQKYLLKEVLYDYVPSSFFDRPKWGFSIPLMKWLKTDLSYLIDEYLADVVIRKHGYVDSAYVNSLRKKFLSGKHDYLYNRLWLLIVLHQFLETKC